MPRKLRKFEVDKEHTIKNEIKKLLRNYSKFFGYEVIIKKVNNGTVSITTPFLDKNNDYIQVYIKTYLELLEITDNHKYLSFKDFPAWELWRSFKSKELDNILEKYKVRIVSGEIVNHCFLSNLEELPLKLHNLISAIIEINALKFKICLI
jgi:hypothetical protein